ncbi:MAG: nodulation protein NfeD [Bacteroidales bacterium]|nr:nodulation protein NfeD [Bacteroidales bacterium]
MMKYARKLLLICIFIALFAEISAQTKIYYYKIDDNISKPALRKTEKAVEEAAQQKSDYLLLELNTFGGELEAADKIRTLLLNAPMPTMVFINNNAASAGALISISCDSIYMAQGSSLGAASVVDQNGQIMPDKYQSYMRSLMRSTAEKNGRNPDIAQAMVDPDVVVKDISDSGKVLTFTSEEALENGFCESIANDREEVLKAAGIEHYDIKEQHLTAIDKIINFLVNPIVSGILIMCIVGGLYFELQAPGLGLPIIIAILAALLYFAPHYLEGLAQHWEILVFLAGLILLMLEFFVIPGFGVAGVSGIVLIFASLILTMVFNVGFHFHFDPNFDVAGQIAKDTILVLLSVLVGFFLSLWLGKKVITADTRFGSLALKTNLDTDKGYTSQDMRMQKYVGRIGTAATFMRPAGKIDIDGEILEATSEHGLIDKGEPIAVIKFENAQLVVRKSENI